MSGVLEGVFMIHDSLPAINPNIPSVARTYAYLLGDNDNVYPSDIALAGELDKVIPGIRGLAINNRRSLRNVVRVLCSNYGIRQFIDNGTGLPTQDSVHQVAQAIDPSARVLYIDNDPVVLAHCRERGLNPENTAFILADMRDEDYVDQVFNRPEARELIDLGQPVGILFISVMHCVPDADGHTYKIVRRFMDRVPPGSALALWQMASEKPPIRHWLTGLMAEMTKCQWGRVRTDEEITPFFAGLEPIDPGIGEILVWRGGDGDVEEQTPDIVEFGGVALKPAN